MVINNATRCNRVLTVQGQRYSFVYRYESWVQYITAPPPPRIALEPLAATLSAEEPDGVEWKFDGVSALTPRLALQGDDESVMSAGDFHDAVKQALAEGEPGWDPYDP